MCMKATCSTCQKATWWGCGNHVPSVMDSIPEEERCSCEPQIEREGKQYPPKSTGVGGVGVGGVANGFWKFVTGGDSSGAKGGGEKKDVKGKKGEGEL